MQSLLVKLRIVHRTLSLQVIVMIKASKFDHYWFSIVRETTTFSAISQLCLSSWKLAASFCVSNLYPSLDS